MRVLDCEGENLQHRNQFDLFEINCDKTTELELTQRLWSLGTFDQLQSLLILEISNYINDVEGRYFLTKTERFPEGCRERSAVFIWQLGPGSRSIPSWSLSVSILSQHGVKLSNFSWALWTEIIYRFLLLRRCILLSWKSLILIIYQNKINPKQILDILFWVEVASWEQLLRIVGPGGGGGGGTESLLCRLVLSWTHVYSQDYSLWSEYCQHKTQQAPVGLDLYLWSGELLWLWQIILFLQSVLASVYILLMTGIESPERSSSEESEALRETDCEFLWGPGLVVPAEFDSMK